MRRRARGRGQGGGTRRRDAFWRYYLIVQEIMSCPVITSSMHSRNELTMVFFKISTFSKAVLNVYFSVSAAFDACQSASVKFAEHEIVKRNVLPTIWAHWHRIQRVLSVTYAAKQILRQVVPLYNDPRESSGLKSRVLTYVQISNICIMNI